MSLPPHPGNANARSRTRSATRPHQAKGHFSPPVPGRSLSGMTLSPTQQRLIFYGTLFGSLAAAYLYATMMPGRSHGGALEAESLAVRAAALDLEAHVAALAGAIGERQVGEGDSLARARDYVGLELAKAASASTELKLEDLGPDGSNAANVVWSIRGQSSGIVLIGAHYDSVPGTPGANDNASGVAIGLYLPSSSAAAASKTR